LYLANNAGYFKAEISPMTIKTKKGDIIFDTDEHPRESTIEDFAKLAPVFQKDGLVTAATASVRWTTYTYHIVLQGICDGAASVVVASHRAVQKFHLLPLARLVGWHVIGCDPSIMGIGPVPAIRGLLTKCQLTLGDIDLIEV
jgi:acetyl-CoA acetyltransferase